MRVLLLRVFVGRHLGERRSGGGEQLLNGVIVRQATRETETWSVKRWECVPSSVDGRGARVSAMRAGVGGQACVRSAAGGRVARGRPWSSLAT